MKSNRLVAPLVVASLAALAFVAASSARAMPVSNAAVPEPAKSVDLGRYLGLWYELGRYENSFERGCEAVTADYRLRPDGLVEVINSCRKGGLAGPLKVARGRAKRVDASQGA